MISNKKENVFISKISFSEIKLKSEIIYVIDQKMLRTEIGLLFSNKHLDELMITDNYRRIKNRKSLISGGDYIGITTSTIEDDKAQKNEKNHFYLSSKVVTHSEFKESGWIKICQDNKFDKFLKEKIDDLKGLDIFLSEKDYQDSLYEKIMMIYLEKRDLDLKSFIKIFPKKSSFYHF